MEPKIYKTNVGKSAIEHKVDEFNEKYPSLHIKADRYDMSGDFTLYARTMKSNQHEKIGVFDIYSIYLESTHPDCNTVALTAEEFIAVARFIKWLRDNYLEYYEEMQEIHLQEMMESIIGPEGDR